MPIWKFPYGYVKIEIVCKRPERFINEALSRGVSLHNVERLSLNTVRTVVHFSHYDDARAVSNDLGAEMRVIKRGGASVLFRELLSRASLMLSLLAAITAMLVLSSRIIFIEVDGAEPKLAEIARCVLESEGILPGIAASAIDKAALSKAVAAADGGIGFAKVAIHGVILRVEVYPSINAASDDGERPSSIYANKDCIILSLSLFDGNAAVKAGDAVRKDQLLVSGDITPEQGGEIMLAHSEAEIIGEVAYGFAVRIEPVDLRPTRSGNTDAAVSTELFGLSIARRPGFDDCDIELTSTLPFDSVFLPVFVRGGRAHELVLKQRRLSRREMLHEAENRLQYLMHAEIPEYAVIVSKSTELIWEDDGALTVRIAVHTYEKIGYTRYL